MALKALEEAEIAQRLKQAASWSRNGAEIQRTFQFPSFLDAIGFVNQVAAHAEHVNHHPDILVQYNRVTLLLSTHDAKGLTERDFDFARAVDETFVKC